MQSRRRSQLVAVLKRCDAKGPFEGADKITHVGKSAAQGHLGHGQTGIFQEMFSLREPQVVDVLRERQVKMLFKIPGDVLFRQMKMLRKLWERDMSGVILLDVGQQFFLNAQRTSGAGVGNKLVLNQSLNQLQQ